HRVGEHARRDLPGQTPAVLAPSALAFLAAVADNRVPVAIRLFLILGDHLKGERFALLELRAAVQAKTRNPENGEFHHQLIALLATRVVTGRLLESGDLTVRKRGGVEPRRLMRVLVEPETDPVFGLHGACLLVLDQGET